MNKLPSLGLKQAAKDQLYKC